MWGGEDVGNARHKNHSYSTLIIISPCLVIPITWASIRLDTTLISCVVFNDAKNTIPAVLEGGCVLGTYPASTCPHPNWQMSGRIKHYVVYDNYGLGTIPHCYVIKWVCH